MKTCKKCGRPLPDKYKARLCENCLGKRVDSLKSAGKAALSVAILVGGTVVTIATTGKFDLGKK